LIVKLKESFERYYRTVHEVSIVAAGEGAGTAEGADTESPAPISLNMNSF